MLEVKVPPAKAGDMRCSSVPGSRRSPGGGHGNSLQYSCLENPMDRRGWQISVHGMAKRSDFAEHSAVCIVSKRTELEFRKSNLYSVE